MCQCRGAIVGEARLQRRVVRPSDRLPRDRFPSRMYVLKGRLLGFLNAACRKTFR